MIISTPSTGGLSLWDASVQNGRTFGGFGAITSGAATFAFVSLHNAASNAKTVIVNRIQANTNVAGLITLGISAGLFGGYLNNPINLSNPTIASLSDIDTNATATGPAGVKVIGQLDLVANTSFDMANCSITVAPGYSLNVYTAVFLAYLGVTFFFSEQ